MSQIIRNGNEKQEREKEAKAWTNVNSERIKGERCAKRERSEVREVNIN